MWFFGLIVVLLIGAVAVVASGRWGAMSTAYDDRPDMTVPARQALTSTDIESARFAVGVRGYRMDEVDTLLERVAKEVAERDRRIADLERAVAPIVEAPDGHGFSSRPYDPAEFEDTGTQPPILVGGPDPITPPAPAPEPAASEDTDSAGSDGSARSDGETSDVPQASVASDAADDEPETTELPRAIQAAADEYERLQAEARAVLEAQSQPVTPRRTPAPHQQPPAQQNQQQEQPAPEELPTKPPTTHWTQQPPQLQQPQAPEAPAQAPQRQAEQDAQEQQAQGSEQAQGQQPGEQQGGANGAAGDGDEEGWRFWPPADQQGEGAYQRPS
ncbi:DivIVA domain-containing protein [Kribbella sp. C-35]|uniref:DivIVA domain-containing protein n=1 Tax=Kribbella sp. C-35 TaxID=2789276 RepID=UPI0039795624